MFGAVAFIEFAKGRLRLRFWSFGERASWMAGMLLASAVIDSLIAPVRSVQWIETGVAWQGSRTAVMTLCLMLGWPVMLFSGTSQGFFWIFFALRLLSDLGGLRPGERERIRANMFGEQAGHQLMGPGERIRHQAPTLAHPRAALQNHRG